jgi:hypothetical protein
MVTRMTRVYIWMTLLGDNLISYINYLLNLIWLWPFTTNLCGISYFWTFVCILHVSFIIFLKPLMIVSLALLLYVYNMASKLKIMC